MRLRARRGPAGAGATLSASVPFAGVPVTTTGRPRSVSAAGDGSEPFGRPPAGGAGRARMNDRRPNFSAAVAAAGPGTAGSSRRGSAGIPLSASSRHQRCTSCSSGRQRGPPAVSGDVGMGEGDQPPRPQGQQQRLAARPRPCRSTATSGPARPGRAGPGRGGRRLVSYPCCRAGGSEAAGRGDDLVMGGEGVGEGAQGGHPGRGRRRARGRAGRAVCVDPGPMPGAGGRSREVAGQLQQTGGRPSGQVRQHDGLAAPAGERRRLWQRPRRIVAPFDEHVRLEPG